MDANTTREIAAMLKAGMRQLSVAELDASLAELGYRREPDSRCTCRAKNMTTGNTYDCVTWGVSEADSGRSAFNVDSRRDEKYKALREIRFWSFAVSRGYVVSI